MDRDRLLRDQTVVVKSGLISAIGRDLSLPVGVRQIDGRGKYLSPGLADMHTHAQTSEEMKIYLANGVTTLLNLGGASTDFVDQLVPLLNRGERPGPHVYLAYRIDGTPQYGQFVVTTPEEGRWTVRLAKTNGYRFIKLYNNLPAPVFAAVADEASRQGLGLAGHYVRALSLEQELKPGHVLIAHLEELMYGLFTPRDEDPLAPPPPAVAERAATLLNDNGGFVIADLVTFQTIAEQWGRRDIVRSYFRSPSFRFVPLDWRLAWERENYSAKGGSLARRAAFEALLARQLNARGVKLLAGTDAPTIPGVVPGFSLHDNLDRLDAAGLTRFQALSTATRFPGEYIAATVGDERPFGLVRVGYRADLILSSANPLSDLSTLRTPNGVMAAGRWYDAAELAKLKAGVAEAYRRAAAGNQDRQ
jgi:hypothetical protein